MGSIFSFLTRKNVLKCAWCGEEMQSSNYTKYVGSKEYNFCSRSCKKKFRNSGRGKKSYSCPSCKLR